MILKLNYDELVSKIKEKGLNDEEINKKIDDKMEQLSGLISREGAAHLIANELGVKIFEDVGKLKISKIMAGMRDVEVDGKVVDIYEVRSFKKNEREGKVGSFLIGDETGRIRIVMWDDNHISKLEKNELKADDIVRLKNCYVKENNGYKEMHLGSGSLFEVNPEGVEIKEVANGASFTLTSKKISELGENDNNVSLKGTVVQIFEPRFYEICEQCGKRARMENGNFNCGEHGTVEIKYAAVINFFLDDGTDNIRVVGFRDQVKSLLEVEEEALLEFRTNISKFEELKGSLLGKQLDVGGRVVKNDMFDRKEFIASSIEELKAEELLNEMEG